MKLHIDRSDERGKADYIWLKTYYSFSFADWYDPSKMGFGLLRVLNDDIIAPSNGFGTHGHKNMEIVTIVTGGEVTHSDSMGNIYTLKAGDVQAMSAGTGVQHSESNKSLDTPLELFQLWISPKERDIEPRYQQKSYDFASVMNSIIFLVGENSLPINQDAYIAYGAIEKSSTILYNLHDKQNGVYVFVIEGSISIGDQKLERRDAAGVSETDSIEILGSEDASFLIIEVPWE